MSPIKALCLNIAHDCNLKCDYCFAAKGNCKGKAELMSLETAKKAIDFLIQHSGERKNLDLEFFGGEPLLNFEVVKETIIYAKKQAKNHNKKFNFTITTNGLLLTDEIMDFINKEIAIVVLSLDGRKKTNDRFRVANSKFGTYDVIVPKFKKMVKFRNNKNYYIRGTYTKHNLDFHKDIMHIYKLGFNKISMQPVICDSKLDYAINKENLDTIFLEYEKLAHEIIKLKKNNSKIDFFSFNIDLEHGPCVIKRIKSCGCGNEYVAVTPNGDIFPCHQFVGYNEYNMGNINQNIFNYNIKNQFLKTTIYHKEKCKNCWAKFYCSGGCNANNYQFNNNVLMPHETSCAIMKKRLECALMIQAVLKLAPTN